MKKKTVPVLEVPEQPAVPAPAPVVHNPTTTPEETQARVLSARAAVKGRRTINATAKRLQKLVVVDVPYNQLAPNDWNPNRQSDHDFELLLRSIEDDGFTQPVIALREMVYDSSQKQNVHIIIDGEHRWRAGGVLGMEIIPTVLVDMTPEQAKIATIRHNRARGSHDIELESAILRDLQQLGMVDVAQAALNLDDAELDHMLNDIAAPEALAGTTYADAWVPDDMTADDAALIRDGVKTTDAEETTLGDGGGKIMRGMTTEAIASTRRREQLIAAAKTSQDKTIARQQSYVYRVALLFSGEEGVVVKAALGAKPAEALLEMCKAKMSAPA